MLTDTHAAVELFDCLRGNYRFIFEDKRTNKEFDTNGIVDAIVDPKKNDIILTFAIVERNKSNLVDYRFNLNDIAHIYFNHNGTRFRHNQPILVSNYFYGSGMTEMRDEIKEIYLSDKFIGDPIIKLTFKNPF